jgi:hypothetical protein
MTVNTEIEGSVPLIPKPAYGHDFGSVLSTPPPPVHKNYFCKIHLIESFSSPFLRVTSLQFVLPSKVCMNFLSPLSDFVSSNCNLDFINLTILHDLFK